ncbi:amidohydrolase [Halobellus sp. Atlit-31R]|nr:amidohydrolase [Halobellus sp. Atlit-31R]
MTAAADLVLTNGEVHTLETSDETHEAVAIRDGRIVRLGSEYDVAFLAGTETETIDLGGRTVLPGFIDAHTHLDFVGRRLVHADLSGAASAEECVDRLRDRREEVAPGEWIVGYGYDESGWDDPDPAPLDRDHLDAVSTDRPVVAFREDMHAASVNGVVFDRVGDEFPTADVRATAGGEPTGVVVEAAVDVLYEAVEPDADEMTELLRAAQRYANERGVTAVHDMTRRSVKPRVYRKLERAGDLSLRVRLNYWSDHLEALREVGLSTNDGSEMVRVGAIKTYTDGSFGARTARLSEPYADADAGADASDAAGGTADSPAQRGTWVVAPDDLAALVADADAAGFQVAAHAIGDEAIRAVLDAYEACDAPGERRHRIEHVELADDDAIERLADLGVVASVQPNFLKWAGEEGLYDARLGDRRTQTNRYRRFLDAGVPLALGSDCMPLDPLFGVHHAVTAPAEDQRLRVTEALRAYTSGAAYAGFDENRLGTLSSGKRADLVALDASPWAVEDVREIDVSLTVVDGDVVYQQSEPDAPESDAAVTHDGR